MAVWLLQTTDRADHGWEEPSSPLGAVRDSLPTHDRRERQLPDGTMTGGNQPTNSSGIDRRERSPRSVVSSSQA